MSIDYITQKRKDAITTIKDLIARNEEAQALYTYYATEALINEQKAHAGKEDDEDFKEKFEEATIVSEFETIALVHTKAHLNFYMKSRLKKIFTSSRLRGAWDAVRADIESINVKNEPGTLNVIDGVFDIKTKEITPREGIFETGIYDKFIPHYNPDAKAPTFEKVLNDLNTEANPDLGEDLLKMYAYCAFGGNKLKTMFILYGEGDDGKTLIQNAIRNALGDYVATVAPKKIRYSRTKEDQFQTWLANMDGKKFAIVSEWGESDRLDNAVVKQVVSGGGSVAELEQKNKNEQKKIQLTAPFVIDTNFLPDVTNVEPALIKRIAVLKFYRQYSDDEKDLNLDIKLKAERAGILNMLIDAYEPNWKVPQKYRQALLDEQAEQQDIIDESIENLLAIHAHLKVDITSTKKIPSSKIFDTYFNRALNEEHLKKKDIKDYFARKGVKANNHDGRGFIGLVHIDNVANQFNY